MNRALLSCGIVAGPLYLLVVAAQMLTRDGFDISRHPASMLSNGEQGWVQVLNFVVTGLLYVAFALGLRRVLGPAAGWGPRLIGVFGAGVLAAAFFTADPADGFPPGTPTGAPTTMSWHGAAHFLVAGIAFLALAASCFVFSKRYAAAGRRARAVFSVVTGVVFLGSWLSLFALMGSRPANVVFALAIALALSWASVLAADHRAADRQPSHV